MTTTTSAAPALHRVGAAPAGLNPAQTRVWERLQAVRAAAAQFPPLDPAYLAGERSWEQWRRRIGED